ELHGFLPVDHAVVIGKRQIHHGTDLNLAIDGYRPLLDLVHAQNRRLWRVQGRRGQQRTEHNTVGNGEGATRHLVDGELAILGLPAVVADLRFDLCQTHVIGVAQHGDHEAAWRGNGHADVLIAVIDDV